MTQKEQRAGLWYYPLQLLGLSLIIELFCMLLHIRLSAAWLNVLYFTLNFFGVVLLFHRFLWKNLKIALQKPLHCILLALGGIGIYMIGGSLVAELIARLQPSFFNVNDAYINSIIDDSYIPLAFCTIILVPIAEETLYRGLMFSSLYNRSRILAFAVSTLAFAAVHVVQYIGAYSAGHLALCLLQYLPAGIAFGLTYALTDTVWAPILMHMIINAIGILSMR